MSRYVFSSLTVTRRMAALGLTACIACPAWPEEPPANPTGGGRSVVLEPAPAPARTTRPVFVCRDGESVTFADRPCGQVMETREIQFVAYAAGQAPSIRQGPARAATRPRKEAPPRTPSPVRNRCVSLREQLEALDDRMRTGYSAREAAKLWNRWRELKAQLHEARC